MWRQWICRKSAMGEHAWLRRRKARARRQAKNSHTARAKARRTAADESALARLRAALQRQREP